jgi:hypothetical protein
LIVLVVYDSRCLRFWVRIGWILEIAAKKLEDPENIEKMMAIEKE